MINGICFYQDGTIVNPGDHSVSTHWSAADIIIVIFVSIIMIISVISFVFKMKERFSKKKQSLLEIEGS